MVGFWEKTDRQKKRNSPKGSQAFRAVVRGIVLLEEKHNMPWQYGIAVTVVIWLLPMIFAAGGIYFSFSRLKKDVDGVGRKVNTTESKREGERRKLLTAFMLISTDEQREQIARILND
jgi:hypothetical protein